MGILVDRKAALEREVQKLRKELLASRARVRQLEADRGELAAIVESSRDAIWSWNADGTIVSWNAEAERLLGYTAEEIVGKSLLTMVPEDRVATAHEVIGNLAEGAWYGQYETVRLKKGGKPIDVELTVSPVFDAQGDVIGASTVCRDISERKQVQAALAKRVSELTILYRLTERLQLAKSFSDIHTAALDAIVDALGCDRASILMFDASGAMRFVAWRGLSDNYRKAVDGHSPWSKDIQAPEPLFIEDIGLSDQPEFLKATIQSEGVGALAFIPLIANGRLIGKFMTYYNSAHAFVEGEVNLANAIARQLGLAVARQLTEEELRDSEQRFRLMSEHAPVMIWMSDADGKCLHLNRMLRMFWGVDEADIGTFDWTGTMHPDDAPQIGQAIGQAIAERRGVSIKGRYLDSYGRYRALQTVAQPRFSGKGDFLGMIGVNVDMTERDEAEAALRESEQRFRLAVEASPSGMVMADKHGRIALVNAQTEKLFGYSRDELVGKKIELLVPDRFRPHHPKYREAYSENASARAMGDGRDLFARRKDGTEVPVEIGLSPLHTPEGAMTLAAIIDISGRKQAEAQRELLVAELNHRVKNTLSVVQGIAHQTFKSSDVAAEARKAFEGRLIALALAHNLLTQTNWENASLEKLAALTLDIEGANAERVSLSGPPILLPPKEAVSIAMALHELYTNAMKYGALSNDAGRVHIKWCRSGEELNLDWQEEGGPPVSPPKRRGFGSLLLERTLSRDLDGRVHLKFEPGGLVCSIAAALREKPQTLQ